MNVFTLVFKSTDSASLSGCSLLGPWYEIRESGKNFRSCAHNFVTGKWRCLSWTKKSH